MPGAGERGAREMLRVAAREVRAREVAVGGEVGDPGCLGGEPMELSPVMALGELVEVSACTYRSAVSPVGPASA
jgi:hypothetical protein